MGDNTFGKWARRYIEAGYSPVPIMPGTKRPGYTLHGEQQRFGNWQRLCDRHANDHEMDLWTRDGAKAGIGIALGFGNVVAIDIDIQPGAIFDTLIEILPDSEWVKKGAKGFTAFFRTEGPMKAQKFKLRLDEQGNPVGDESGIRPGAVLEILGYGNQTVIPPTVHPGTGEPYSWEENPLSMCPAQALPVLPAEFPDLVKEALEPYGYIPRSRDHQPGVYKTEHGSAYADLNAEALTRLDDWVPHLDRVEFDDDHRGDGYRMRAVWRGGDSTSSVRIDSEMIFDYGADEKISPIDLIIYLNDMTPGEAFGWLFERLNPDIGDIILQMSENSTREQEERAAREHEEYAQRMRQLAMVEAEAKRQAEIEDMDEFSSEQITQEVHSRIEDWKIGGKDESLEEIMTGADGMMRDLVDICYDHSNRDSIAPPIAAAIGIMSVLFGRRWAGVVPNTMFETHPNTMVALAVDSGVGKTTTMNVVRDLHDEAMDKALEAGGQAAIARNIPVEEDDEDGKKAAKAMQHIHGCLSLVARGQRVFSASGIMNVLRRAPNNWSMIDECGPLLKEMFSGRPGSNAETKAVAFKELTTASANRYTAAVYASTEALEEDIMNPCYSVTLTGTPKQIWDNIPPSGYEDGFVGRILFISDDRYAKSKEPRINHEKKASVIAEMSEIIGSRLMAGDLSMGGYLMPHIKPDIIRVERSARAEKVLKTVAEWVEDESQKAWRSQRPDRPIWTRFMEMVYKLALLHALGRNWRHPEVIEGDVYWGARLAMYSIRQAANHAMGAAATSVRSIDENRETMNRITMMLLKNGGEMTLGDLNRKVGIKKAEGLKILETMQDSGDIVMYPGSRVGSIMVKIVT